MPVEITYYRDVDRQLTTDEVDDNFLSVADAVVALEADRPNPNEFVSVTREGLELFFNLADGSRMGPIDLPVAAFHFYESWLPFFYFTELDTFVVEGVGMFATVQAHTTGASFDPALVVNGSPAYQKLMGADAGSSAGSAIYDIELGYDGVLSTMTRPINFIALRSFIVPAQGNQHKVRLEEPPSTAQQIYPIAHNGTQIGTATVEIGENVGTVIITATETIPLDDRLSLLPPLAPDATAAGLMLAIAAQRVM